MGVFMDTFVQALLVERSTLDCDDNNDSYSSAAECVVVVDNAKHHAERWSELPRGLRSTLLSNKTDPTRRKQAPKKKLVVARTKSNEDRWNPKQVRSEGKEAMPAPPSCPQRQQSIEVTAEALAHMTMMDHSSASTSTSSPAAHSDSLCSDVDCVVQKPPRCPQRRGSVDIPKDSPNSVLLQMGGLGEVPRMPQRQASDDSECCFLPPPPMTAGDFTNEKMNASAPLLGSFSSFVKRSNASLLDDDDDSDDEEVPHPNWSYGTHLPSN